VKLVRLPSWNTKHLDTATHVLFSTLHALGGGSGVSHYQALAPSSFAFLPRWFGIRTVVTVHGLDWQREKWGRVASWALRQCEAPAVRFPDRPVSVSLTLQDYFRDHHHRETVYIPNGTHLPVSRPPTRLG